MARGRTIRGLAAVYGSSSEDLGFYEVIKAGAFRGADVSEVQALHNHNPDRLLGSTESGTLQVSKTKAGLRYVVDVPRGPMGDDVLESVRRGDTAKSSFAFTVAVDEKTGRPRDRWYKAKGKVMREIEAVEKVWDVSPVGLPAYKATTCTAD